MALPNALLRVIILALALAHLGVSNCHLVKGSVACLDCPPHHDLSGVRVAVDCNHERKLVAALTNDKGYFEAEIPSDSSPHTSSSHNCLARLLGGPEQLWSSEKAMVSKVVKSQESNYYALSTPLTFFSSCPPKAEHLKLKNPNKSPEVGSSKTMDLPLPPEWGLAPSSYYYYPFLPIIGIP